MIINIAIIILLLYICVGITFIVRLIYRQAKGTNAINKPKSTVTIVKDEGNDTYNPMKIVSSRVIPLTDEYEYDQSTKFKNLSNR